MYGIRGDGALFIHLLCLNCFVHVSVMSIWLALIIFQMKQIKFRETFRATAPYKYNAVHPYTCLDKVGV